MKHPHRLTFAGALLAVLLGVGFAWFQVRLRADEATPPSDKWAQVQANNTKMLEDLDAVDENLKFAKARSMQGAHKP